MAFSSADDGDRRPPVDDTIENDANAEEAVRERALIARVRAGDVTAFEAIYEQFGSGLITFASAQLGSREIAKELVQDLFLGLWKQRHQWVVSGALKPYLFGAQRKRIASYLGTGAVRHEATDGARLYGLPSTEHADDRVRRADLRRAIERAIAALPPRRREVFLLVKQQRLAYADVAVMLGISVKAVEMHMLRAFEVLREQLADWRG